MERIYLISESYIKKYSNLDDNVWGEYLTPAIWEAQEMGLQSIIGTSLYSDILDKVSSGDKTTYKELIENYIQSYLMYKVISNLVPIIGVKLANLGTVISNDEHVQNLTKAERGNLQQYYQQRADFYCRRLQEYLINNKDNYEALDECSCASIKANLRSAASTGLFLGGARGRMRK